MAAAVVLVLGIAILWLLHTIVQFIAALTLIALVSCLLFIIAAYGLSFLGFYFILGQAYMGWSIFGAMFAGSLIVSRGLRKAKDMWAQNHWRHDR
jgi:hypothetical protein